MNTSTIVEMIKIDPTIENDISSFVKKMNEKTIRLSFKTKEIVIDSEVMASFAELNGGECTDKDVQYALSLMDQAPLLKEAEERLQKVKDAISSGEVSSVEDIITKFSEEKN